MSMILKDELGRFSKGNKGYWFGKKRSQETKDKISKFFKGRFVGNKHPNWSGGRKKTVAGYMKVYAPGHHRAQKDKYVLEHIVIMEKHLGRKLDSDECIHHINGIKNDNRIENLIVLKKSAHKSFHANERWGYRSSMLTKEFLEKQYIENKRTSTDIAKEVGLNHNTILVKLRKSGLRVRVGNDKEYYGWAKKYNSCMQCNTKKIRHQARGYCWKCYRLVFGR